MGNLSFQLPVFALAILFQICSILSKANFFYKYVGETDFDLTWLCFHLSVGTLLLFLALHDGHLRPLLLACAVIQWCTSLLSLLTQKGMLMEYGDWYVCLVQLPQITGFFTLLAAIIGKISDFVSYIMSQLSDIPTLLATVEPSDTNRRQTNWPRNEQLREKLV